MKKSIIEDSLLFEVKDVFSKRIRTSKKYWQYILETKHKEAIGLLKVNDAFKSIQKPDEVYRTEDKYVLRFYKRNEIVKLFICTIVRYLNGDGFIITSYLTSKKKRRGEKIWPKAI